MDTLVSMEIFAKVAEARSFAEAARQLRMSPSMVTKHVQALESRVGARLINRNSRQSHLTEAGVLYWQHCRTLISQLRQVEDEAGALGRLPRGRLRLTAATDFGAVELEPAVLEFMNRYPDINIDLELTSRFVDLMKEEFDVAIRMTERPLDGNTLVARRIASSRLVLCASPDYLRRHGRPAEPDELAEHLGLVYAGTSWGNQWPFVRAGEARTVRIPARLQTNNNQLLCEAASKGMGIVIQPTFNVWDRLRSGELELLLDEWHVGQLGIHVVFPHRQFLPAKVRVFIDFLVKRFRTGTHQDLWLDRANEAAGQRPVAPIAARQSHAIARRRSARA
jgi:DNA-binding transcriptional LysR family regulator